MKRKVVLVKWIDSIETGGWGKKPESNMSCLSAGFLVEKTKDYILIALNVSAYSDGEYLQIPMVAVKSVKTLMMVDKPA
jgi:hypothetical protein